MQTVRGTVLLVEDDIRLRKNVRQCLEKIGLRVVEVGDGRSAIRQLTEEPPDIVLLDLILPEISGYEICELIRASTKLRHIPILVMSPRQSPADRAHAEKAGASGYLVKPFTIAELVAKVRHLLTAPSSVTGI